MRIYSFNDLPIIGAKSDHSIIILTDGSIEQNTLRIFKDEMNNSDPILIIDRQSFVNEYYLDRFLSSELSKYKDWDLCYLCRWMDHIHKLSDKKSSVIRTMNPHGLQAIIYTKKVRDMIMRMSGMRNGKLFTHQSTDLENQLNHEIRLENIRAIATSPNIIQFDPGDDIKASDAYKLSEFDIRDDNVYKIAIPRENHAVNPQGWKSFLFFVIIVIVSCLIIYLLWWFASNFKKPFTELIGF
jgi:hypothetical protein